MKSNLLICGITAMAMSFSACSTHYVVDGVKGARILVDSTYDHYQNADITDFMRPYKQAVDSIMSPVVGHTARSMSGYRPESPLSNLLADILVWAAKDYGESPVLGVYNMGGIRAALPAGKVTFGDVLDVAPFENKICFLTLSGEMLTRLFQEIAGTKGEGVSHGVEMVVSGKGELISAKLNGQEIDPAADYRITTINYLAEGNDHLEAFKAKKDFVSPQDYENNTRFIIANYFMQMEKAGKVVDSEVEGRITIKE